MPIDVSEAASNQYFRLMAELEAARKARNFPGAVAAARASLAVLPGVIESFSRRSHGGFDCIATIPAIDTGGTLMAVLGDASALAEMRGVVSRHEPLAPWMEVVEAAEAEMVIVSRILDAIAAQPGLRQRELKSVLNLEDGRRASYLAGLLEDAGRLTRVKDGATWRLFPVGDPGVQAARSVIVSTATVRPAAPITSRADTGRRARGAVLVSLDGLPIVRLPRAPLTWEVRARESGAPEPAGRDAPRFAVEGTGWAVTAETKLPPAERPDPAFSEVFPTATTTYWLDPKGKHANVGTARAVLQAIGTDGSVNAEVGLAHDVYRADVSPRGEGILFLSREAILHGYTDALDPLISEPLLQLPEIAAQVGRFGIGSDELKNFTRAISLSGDLRRYLVTMADEAWCFDMATGAPLWGVRMPTREGWTRRINDRSDRVGTSSEVTAALDLVGLHLPITPDELTRQYRRLAMAWHPDRNPRDASAGARMQALNVAMELLSGTNLSMLSGEAAAQVTYEQVLSQHHVADPAGEGRLTITASLVISERFGVDWVYAANMGAEGRVFVATYSGRVLVLDPEGRPKRVYDIGCVPRQVADVGRRLYVLTDTRLYVLEGDQLVNLVDVYGRGDLVLAGTGFGLLEAKRWTWFDADGQILGAIRTKDPIRRIHRSEDELVIETRQHRVVVGGTPAWWQAGEIFTLPKSI